MQSAWRAVAGASLKLGDCDWVLALFDSSEGPLSAGKCSASIPCALDTFTHTSISARSAVAGVLLQRESCKTGNT